jgi:hypothetical protein
MSKLSLAEAMQGRASRPIGNQPSNCPSGAALPLQATIAAAASAIVIWAAFWRRLATNICF